jgi:hypothetical protein
VGVSTKVSTCEEQSGKCRHHYRAGQNDKTTMRERKATKFVIDGKKELENCRADRVVFRKRMAVRKGRGRTVRETKMTRESHGTTVPL